MIDYGIHLLGQHAELLAGSAIPPEVARERGYVSVDTKGQLDAAGFSKAQKSTPGLLIPVHCPDGAVRLHQYRPDNPRLDSKGRPRKYETPYKATMRLDCPPRCRTQVADPSVPLWVTEGVRKADAAAAAGLCCLALLGVDNWRGTNGAGGKTALADWHDVALNGRSVFVAYDSDVMVKAEVKRALTAFTAFLESKGATVRHVYLPHGDGGAKVGLDDYLAAGHTVDELYGLARDPEAAEAQQELPPAAGKSLPVAEKDGAALLDNVREFCRMFIAFPDEHALAATVLWCAHAHALPSFGVMAGVASREKPQVRALHALSPSGGRSGVGVTRLPLICGVAVASSVFG